MVFEPAPTHIHHGVEHETTLANATTRYWEYGTTTAPLIVLIHGFRGDHHGLELIAQPLLDNYRIIIPDLPGFGRSDSTPQAQHNISTYAAWLIDFINFLGETPHVLVGHSFGSIICTYAAVSRPTLCHKLTLINPISEPALEGNQKLISALASSYYALGAKLPEPLGFRWLRLAPITRASSRFMMRTDNPELQRFINAQHDAYFGAFTSQQTVLEAYQASISETAAYYAPALRVPTQMIVAEDDDLGTLHTAQTMYDSISQARMDVIPRVGHLIHYETPARAATLIDTFAKETA